MKRAFFITGFNNWGKTTIINHLFNGRKKFYFGVQYSLMDLDPKITFTVQSQSNDDLWGEAFATSISERLDTAPDGGENLLAALCPSIEETNDFRRLLSSAPFTTYDQLTLLLLEYKWDYHARLITDHIENAGRQIANVRFVTINSDEGIADVDARFRAKINQSISEIASTF